MNSINIGAASTGNSLGLLPYSLSASRHSIARSLYSSSTNMNAAISTSKQGKGVSDGHDDHPVRASSKGIDPISLRTVTVDESFNRMEELVGSEEEEKNWKGIVIALVVIGVILGLIAMAIVLVTPRPEKYDPGKNLTFSSLINREIRPRTPVFKWIRGSDNFYTVYERYQLDTVDQLVRRYVTINDASVNETAGKSTFLSQDILSSTLRGAESFQVSPNLNYALTQIDSTTNSIFTNSIYKIYDRTKSSVIDIEGASTQLLYATWIGTNQELVYIKDNNILYKESPEANAVSVTSDGSTSILNGISNRLYKVFIFPDLESLIWPSPYDSKFVYAKIEESVVTSYSGSQLNSNTVERESAPSSSEVTVHLFDSGVSNQLELPVTAGYLTSVSWMDEDRVIVVWLMTDHQSEKFFICNCKTKQCSLNFEYKSSKLGLSWVGMYGAPIYNHDREEYYTLLPDPANENKLYRHIAVIKVDETQRQEASQPFLTSHPWSDLKILKVDGDRLYYLSTGLNYTHQHLYSVSLDTKTSRCWTCKDLGLGNYTFVEAEFSWSNSYIYLSILGPDMPSYYVVDATDLTIEKNISLSVQVDREHYEALQVYYDGIYLPITEYVTFKLDNNIDASVKLVLPPIFRRERSCLYEVVIVANPLPGSRIATQKFSLDYYDYLAKNQTYIIVYADVRGSGGRGERVRQAVKGNLGFAEGEDISRVISYLNVGYDHYKVDKDYVAVMGLNYGGFVSLHTLANKRQYIKCGVITSPFLSLSADGNWLVERYMNSTAAPELDYDCNTGTSSNCAVPFRNVSLFLIHGTEDLVVPIEHSFSLMSKLQLLNFDFRQQIYPEVGNNLEDSDVNSHYYQTITNFLNECFEIRFKVDKEKIDYCMNR